MDKFFTQSHCDRCKGELNGGRTMSRFNTDCICILCSEKDKGDPEYERAVKEELKEVKKGNYNFKGTRG